MSIQFITGRYINAVNDTLVGGAGTSGTGASPYLGQLGHELELSSEEALKLSDTSIGTLYAGRYKYVKNYASSAQTPVRGNIAYWNDADDYVVTPDVASGCLAGIFLGAYPATGKYGYIQMLAGGIGSVLFKTTPTKATPAACDLVSAITQSSKGVGDVLADATALTSVEVRNVIGIANEAPVSATVKQVQLWTRGMPAQNIGA